MKALKAIATISILTLLVACTVLGGSLAIAQQLEADTQIPAEAQRRLEHIIGQWDCRWDYLDAEGKVVASANGSENASWAVPGRIVDLSTVVEGRPGPSKAWMYYSQPEQQFKLISVDPMGDLWELGGDLERFLITSKPHRNSDGREMIIRFDHFEDDHDHLRAEMEYSFDGGQTWTLGFKQYLSRRSAGKSP